MSSTVNYAHDGTYLLGFGSAGGAVYPEGSIVEAGYPPGWPIPQCPSARHRWNIHTAQWDETPLTDEEAWAQVRAKRDELLAASDREVMKAYEAGVPLPKEWRDYRQALRDITLNEPTFNVVWPHIPAAQLLNR
ncbi:phage tail assembly chaperone [Comamonas sp. JUb58]|uniref:phage tail assembly chaperone n=1 Tax=Comamonas sp. JUb58 TaxID=2485114 RepID=UPI001061ED77|nr:phage tail assembly chaperone [Comamonas sp. JUb58]TDS74423.1 phage tail assembly chaperone [Comamonas sp. JUb58]